MVRRIELKCTRGSIFGYLLNIVLCLNKDLDDSTCKTLNNGANIRCLLEIVYLNTASISYFCYT